MSWKICQLIKILKMEIQNQKFDFSSKYGDWTQEGWANEMENGSDTEDEVETNIS